MNLHPAEVTYFIEQVAGAAMSFGVAADDLTPVGTALMNLFGYKCLAPATVIPAQGANLQLVEFLPLFFSCFSRAGSSALSPVASNPFTKAVLTII